MKKTDKKQQNLAINKYDPATIELKWQSIWQKEEIYHPDLESANPSTSSGQDGSTGSPLRPFYNLMMFPYPSAEGLHIGGVRTFAGVDIYGRFKRMQGNNVFQPFGLDGFGIHAENYALKIGKNPMTLAQVTEKNFYRQIKEAGIGVDWGRTVETYKPDYYKWTQWLFVQLFKEGLAYRKKSPVNFCPSCKTVLADEQVIDGKCERCSSVVEKKNLEQWFFRITKYADRLLGNIDSLNWTEKVKIAQRNWIGRSEGARIEFKVQSSKFKVEVFTTAIDTIYGVTFMVISPENPLVQQILKQVQDEKVIKSVNDYISQAKNKSDIERAGEGKEKTGVFSGAYMINPFNGEKVPLWVADYVLMGYGTGAVMGVPGHDARDHEFAKKFGLPIKPVVKPKEGVQGAKVEKDGFWDYPEIKTKFADKSELFDSGEFNGLTNAAAKAKMLEFIKEKEFGDKTTTYHLRDWLISRQRYWGPPIPMIYCEKCATKGLSWFTSEHSENSAGQKVRQSDKSENQTNRSSESSEFSEMSGWFPEENLPVKLPYIEDFKPLGSAKQNSKGEAVNSPLANHPEFFEVKCPHCGHPARRETDVSDTFLDSAWYFLRYLATDQDDIPFPMLNPKSEALNPKQIQNTNDKNSKQIGNLKLDLPAGKAGIGNSSQRLAWLPVHMYIGGAEHSVLHLLYARFITMFLKDLGKIGFEEPFARFFAHGLIIKDGAKMSKSKGNVVGPDLYIKKFGADSLRMYLHFMARFSQEGDFRDEGVQGMHRFLKKIWKLFSEAPISNFQFPISNNGLRMMHQTIKLVTEEMENLRFNTAIAHLMTYYNFLSKQNSVSQEEAEVYLKLLAPFAPHMAEDLFQQIFKDQRSKIKDQRFESIHTSPWPKHDKKYLVADTVKIPVQVNGKLRGMLEVPSSESKDKAKIEEMARKDQKVAIFLEGKNIKQAIYIEGKVLNFVIDM